MIWSRTGVSVDFILGPLSSAAVSRRGSARPHRRGSPLSQTSSSAGECSNTTGGADGSVCQARIRRRPRRYDKTATSFQATVTIAALLQWL
ncbi:hypothetical protein GCM10009541_29500 [Micromonospora gifhornensis]|uniref:Transposase DDE domain-containing protein n=1 Tax=Micromonospora gifhornensis TaxID=84594 RepID=A0ABQ4I8I3_9ACTN|nr:hypothetical protein Vgi01_08670 [Micromonospora gifhornensis]